MFETSSLDRPYPREGDFHADFHSPLFSENSTAGKLFRETVYKNLIESPQLCLSPYDESILQEWRQKDATPEAVAQPQQGNDDDDEGSEEGGAE